MESAPPGAAGHQNKLTRAPANEACKQAFAEQRPCSKISCSIRLVLRSLHIRGVRAHVDSSVHFDDGINLIIGPNGAGKTNILESIHLLCLSRSFLTTRDNVVLRRDAGFYEVQGEFETQARGTQKVRVAYVPGEGKKVFVGGAALDRLTDIVGRFPVVVFSPDDQRLTAEGPEFRRRFIDNIVAQSSPVYLDHLLRYRLALKQRNELLHRARRTRITVDPVVLQGLTASILEPGSAIIAARLAFIDAFSVHLDRAYQRISDVAERPSIQYKPFPADLQSKDVESVRLAFLAQLESTARREQERGMTMCGPHRHDLDLFLDDLPVRRYASQGQHRTFGMALKLAQYDYMQDRGQERPLLLLDDVFDNLDPARIEAFLAILGSGDIGQNITTAARREIVHNHLDPSSCRTIFVERGAKVVNPPEPDSAEVREQGPSSDPATTASTTTST